MKCEKCNSENVLVTIDNDIDVSRANVKQVALISMFIFIGLFTGLVGGIVGGVTGKIIWDILKQWSKDRFDNIVICQDCGYRSIEHHSTKLNNHQKVNNVIAIVLSSIGFGIGLLSSVSFMELIEYFVWNWLWGAMFMLFVSAGCLTMASRLRDGSKTKKIVSGGCFAISILFLVLSL